MQVKGPKSGDGKSKKSSVDEKLNGNVKTFVVLCIAFMLVLFCVHCTWVTSNAYSSPSIVLSSYSSDG